jgi:predicted ATPase
LTPLVVVLYGGPGTGKSTTAAGLFADLKMRGVNCELVHEVAKDFVWEKRATALAHQPYLVTKQMFHMDRMGDQVDVIVTDTSTLYALIYGENLLPEFTQWIIADYKARRTLNIFLDRNPSRPYSTAGRYQSEEEAVACDGQIKNMLDAVRVYTHVVPAGRPDTVLRCSNLVRLALV